MAAQFLYSSGIPEPENPYVVRLLGHQCIFVYVQYTR